MWMKVRKIRTWNHKLYPELASPEQIANVGAVCMNLIIELPTQRKVVTKLWTYGRRCGKWWEINEPLATALLSSHFHSRSSVSCWSHVTLTAHTKDSEKTDSIKRGIFWLKLYLFYHERFDEVHFGSLWSRIRDSHCVFFKHRCCRHAQYHCRKCEQQLLLFFILCNISFKKGKKW